MFRHRKGHAIVSTTTLQLTITNLLNRRGSYSWESWMLLFVDVCSA